MNDTRYLVEWVDLEEGRALDAADPEWDPAALPYRTTTQATLNDAKRFARSLAPTFFGVALIRRQTLEHIADGIHDWLTDHDVAYEYDQDTQTTTRL